MLAPAIHQKLGALKFYSSTNFKQITLSPEPLCYLYKFGFMILLPCLFSSPNPLLQSEGLEGRASSLCIFVPPEPGVQLPYIEFLTMSPVTALGAALMGPTYIHCPIKLLSKLSRIYCCPWSCHFIILSNFIFTSSCLIHEHIYLWPEYLSSDLNAHCQRHEKEAETPLKTQVGPACWWPQAPSGEECFEKIFYKSP